MPTFALVRGRAVVNVVVAPEGWRDPDAATTTIALADGQPAGPGWSWDGETFAAPSPPRATAAPSPAA